VPQKSAADRSFAEFVQAGLKQVEQSRELNEATKAAVRELYQQALRELESARTWAIKADRFERMAAAAPGEIAQIKAELAAMPSVPAVARPADAALPQFDQAISKREADLDRWKSTLAELEAEPKHRASRRLEIAKLAAAALQQQAAIDQQLQAPSAMGDASPLASARRILLLAGRRALEQEILAYDKEQAAYEATADLLTSRRDLAARQAALVEQEIKQWQQLANRRRQQEAQQQVVQAGLEANRARPAVRQLAQENAALADKRNELARRITETTRQLEQTSTRLDALNDQFQRTREKVETVGLTNAVGLLLRKQRNWLPSAGQYHRSINARQLAIREGRLELLELEDQRTELANIEVPLRVVLQKAGPTLGAGQRAELQAAVCEALQTKKQYLEALIADHNGYFEKLVDLDNAERQLINGREQFARYIDERVLWIPSHSPLGAGDVRYAADAVWWLAGPDAWREVGLSLSNDAARSPALPVAALCVFAPLIFSRPRLRHRLRRIGQQAVGSGCCRFQPTLEVLLLTGLIAVVWPALAGYAAWRLSAALDASQWCKAVGAGLAATAGIGLLLQVLRQVCQPEGLGEAHFGWPAASVKVLRQYVAGFSVPILPLVFLAVTMAAQENDRWDGTLGRMSFIAAMLLFSLFLQRILRPSGGVFQAVLQWRGGGWPRRLRYLWYPLLVLTPAALAVLAAAGYYYTSQQLAQRLVMTVSLLVVVALLRSLLLRWARACRRKLAVEQARQRRTIAQPDGSPGEAAAAPAGPLGACEPHRDLATINTQTRRLIEYSLAAACLLLMWLVWVDVTPALGALQRVEVWQTSLSASQSVTASDGSAAVRSVERLGAVTLADVILAALVLGMTLVAARNLPGLLEMAVLQHLPVDAGARYALATVSRYLITIVGLMSACHLVGFGWSKVQWLIAGVSVGLGFGLQEVFANFVSGLIILFERPVRVGDVITIDEVTGTVARIRMRATTVIDGDRRELIIPNKEFITGRVLNWTLSDQVNRVVISVGIAYGSDTERAAELLLKAAKEHPAVLVDPAPKVTLESFGQSALNFVLQCFLPNLEQRSTVIHELHMAIDRAFREAGIEIAFPQQDVHVRSIDLGLAVLRQAAAALPSPAKAPRVRRDGSAERRSKRIA
jgi:potassium efflux system protein